MSVETLDRVTKTPDLPEPVVRRGITEAQWRTLCNSLFPGADPQSVLMVVDYCAARKLDPLKKPCHIVPMRTKDAKTGEWGWRDVVMPGIYEYRTTAQRTGEYLGHGKPEYGPVLEIKGVKAPEWCEMTIYRHSRHQADGRIEFPVRRYFAEVVGLTKDGVANDRWSKAPIQMLEKCTEAAGLREAFPDEFGGEPTAEEMDDQRVIDVEPVTPVKPAERKSQQSSEAPVAGPSASAHETKPEATRSEPPAAAQTTESSPASPTVGLIVSVDSRPGGTLITLDTGFKAASNNAEIIQGALLSRQGKVRVELVTRAAKVAGNVPVILEVIPVGAA